MSKKNWKGLSFSNARTLKLKSLQDNHILNLNQNISTNLILLMIFSLKIVSNLK
jgi:hypothetical protein